MQTARAILPIDDTALIEGPVSDGIADPLRVTQYWQIGRDAFRLALPSGLTFHYRRGSGTVYSRPAGVSDEEVALFFDGSVRGAIAWIAGLVPLHASAVLHDGGVYAFTGASGEGKSTLVAALGNAGFTIFTDDVLVVDPAGIGKPVALPGSKRSKLWSDALALTGMEPVARVRPGEEKFFVDCPRMDSHALPLRTLYALDSLVAAPVISPIHGGHAFETVREAYYRPQFGTAIIDPASYFRATMRLARGVNLRRFGRSRDRAAFGRGVEAIVADLTGQAASKNFQR